MEEIRTLHQSQERAEELKAFERLLGTPDGQMLLDELAANWDGWTLMGESVQETAYKIGLRDAFKYLVSLANGELISNE